ncbi:MAG: phosphate signaling complex protein PhoU [Ignavibacteriae bacterium]|nr:phosphate signaling complex protein PhoU [Ignavibacteriota bacterium]MCB9217026.1 phosphate signaling complex protein PhoU [Ignavibacteria bacterium]
MTSKFERELDKLRSRIIKMGSAVDEQVELAFRCLNDWDEALALHVMGRDEKVDRLDIKIERQCLRIFALQQPVASDLRLIMAALNINSELERMGDLAYNIAKAVSTLKKSSDTINRLDVKQLTDAVQSMVRHTIDSFVDSNLNLALSVMRSDRRVDQYEERIRRQTIQLMKENPDFVEAGATLIIQLRNMERIADHATNVAEEVIFVAKAKIVPNRFDDDAYEELEREIGLGDDDDQD